MDEWVEELFEGMPSLELKWGWRLLLMAMFGAVAGLSCWGCHGP